MLENGMTREQSIFGFIDVIGMGLHTIQFIKYSIISKK